MIVQTARFFEGELRYLLKITPEQGANLFLFSQIPCFNGKATPQGYEISIARKEKKALLYLCASKNIEAILLWERGLVPFLKHLLCRPGLALGIILALFLVYQSFQYVWQIKIEGNDTLSEEQVVEILGEYGFFVGCRYPSLDLHTLCNTLPIGRKDIAWISINMMGAVAEVQIIENREKPSKEPPAQGLVNLVAGREGQIVRYELSTGRAMVSIGQTVSKGQLLVAGFSDKDTGLYPKMASGKVYAKVSLYKSVYIPLKQTKKTVKEEAILEKSINILGKKIIFFKNSRFLEEEYVTIDDEYRPSVLGIALPLPIQVKRAKVYKEQSYTIGAEEAREQAKKQLLLQAQRSGKELLETSFYFTKEDEGVRAVLIALCVCDIATPAEVGLPSKNEP